MLKKITYILHIVKNVNVNITKMPLLMIIFAGIGLLVSVLGGQTSKDLVYIFLNGLFFFIPLTVLKLVTTHSFFTKKKRKNLLKRMIITIIPGIIGIVLFYTNVKNVYLVLISFLGFVYFLIDFIKQTDLAFKIIQKPKTSLKSEKAFYGAMATKCSRTVFFETLPFIENQETKKYFKERAKKYSFIKKIHLFPLTDESLTERIFRIKF